MGGRRISGVGSQDRRSCSQVVAADTAVHSSWHFRREGQAKTKRNRGAFNGGVRVTGATRSRIASTPPGVRPAARPATGSSGAGRSTLLTFVPGGEVVRRRDVCEGRRQVALPVPGDRPIRPGHRRAGVAQAGQESGPSVLHPGARRSHVADGGDYRSGTRASASPWPARSARGPEPPDPTCLVASPTSKLRSGAQGPLTNVRVRNLSGRTLATDGAIRPPCRLLRAAGCSLPARPERRGEGVAACQRKTDSSRVTASASNLSGAKSEALSIPSHSNLSWCSGSVESLRTSTSSA